MPKLDLTEYARQLALQNGRQAMLPVIEKELLHYEILSALEKGNLLSGLVFQGGTCLRLCYGANRYSEDLDFTGGTSFNSSALENLKGCIENALPEKYLVDVRVQEPSTGSLVSRWRIVVSTAPQRPDLPMQRISLEVAAVPSYSRQPRMLQLNYEGLLASYADTIVYAESLEEILADKLESFACSPHLRYRDIWDMHWLARMPHIDLNTAYDFRKRKEADYHEADVFSRGVERVCQQMSMIVEGEEFQNQMQRFLPVDLYEKTILRQSFREVLIETIMGLYEGIRPGDECVSRGRVI